MNRRLLILIISAAVIILGVVAYFVFFAPKTPSEDAASPFNLFGSSDETVTPSVNEPKPEVGETANGAGQLVAPHLVKITAGPVARGVAAITTKQVVSDATATSFATTTVFDTETRYIERASGNVYAYRVNARTLTRLSNRTLPGVEESVWLSDGSLAYARFESENADGTSRLETFALPAMDQGGYFLEQGLSEVAVVGTTSVLTLFPSTSGSIATVARPDGTNPKTLFTSPLSALRIMPSGKGFAAFTKASAQSLGYGFSIGSNGAFERIAGPLRGLVMLPSPSGKTILYSYLSGSAIKTELVDVATRSVTSLPLSALADKCVWGTDEQSVYCAVPRSYSGTLPDDWYQGAASFSDRLWRIDLDARFAILIVDPTAVAKTDIDAVSLTVDPRADALLFINKKDGSLWAYDL